ncbi:MAG: hypothetical protein AB8H47_06325 [Bacteroidia bacterium]
MKSIPSVVWLSLAIVVLGLSLFFFWPQKAKQKKIEAVELPSLGPEADLAVPVIWDSIPSGILFRAERSDWDVYARGERSIVVYDFRAEAMFTQAAGDEIRFHLSLLDEADAVIRERDYSLVFLDANLVGDMIPLHWRWQDTISTDVSPSKLKVSQIQVQSAMPSTDSLDNIALEHIWRDQQPPNLDFEFIARQFQVLNFDSVEGMSLFLVLASHLNAEQPVEYLKVNLDLYDKQDSLLESIERNLIDSYDPPLRNRHTLVNRFLISLDAAGFSAEEVERLGITILEADY